MKKPLREQLPILQLYRINRVKEKSELQMFTFVVHRERTMLWIFSRIQCEKLGDKTVAVPQNRLSCKIKVN